MSPAAAARPAHTPVTGATPSREAWADLLACHLTRPAHLGAVVVLHSAPRIWPLAEARAPMVWAHAEPLHGSDFFARPGRHPAARERLHPVRDAAELADHLRRADLRVLVVTPDADATARLAASVPAAQWATRSLVVGAPDAAGWQALTGLQGWMASGWQPLPVPGLRALASPDVAAALAAAGLPLAPDARWGAAQAQRLAAALLAVPPLAPSAASAAVPRAAFAALAWASDAAGLAFTWLAEGASAIVCAEPGHAWHTVQQGHAVLSASGKAQLWLPYEGGGGGHYRFAPLGASVAGAVWRQGSRPSPGAWQAITEGSASGHALTLPGGGESPLVQLALNAAAMPRHRFAALTGVCWTVALEQPGC